MISLLTGFRKILCTIDYRKKTHSEFFHYGAIYLGPLKIILRFETLYYTTQILKNQHL